ncbi:MAG: NADPH:quinone oxidoreductase family protein [Roseovarius sp.]|nr:NADPH:quinone oxidoreductase family protein [Roseovarius sp.]
MRAYQALPDGQPPALRELPLPSPGPGEVRLSIGACGLNFADLLMIRGEYQDMPPPPFTLGMEVAGVVDACGEGVDKTWTGRRVAVFGGHGGLAEFGCFPADRCVPLPEEMTPVDAAAFQVAYGTSHVALGHRAGLRAGETLLVLGAAGGVGLSAVEIGKLMGARVVACARGKDKLDIARAAGADVVLDSGQDDIRARCKELGGVDVVYDPVGGEGFRAALKACRPEARILIIGFASGEVPQIPANHLLVKNVSVLGFYWGGYLAFRPEVLRDSLSTLFSWYGEGRLKPHVSHVLPLERAGEGLELLRTRRSTGKVVITPSPPAAP